LSVWEGFPSAPCEAMLCECVPIASPVAALPEIIGDTGYILERKDPDQLEALIAQALTSDLDLLGRKARQRIMERFPPTERLKFLRLVERMADVEGGTSG
jgi:glycosyltransferase involved in cell wall biosynthesis